MNDDALYRYKRNILLCEIGEKGQEILLNSKVLIIGAGGLGSPALKYLAAAGVGELGIVDGDTVDLSNLQRQTLYDELTLGKPKVLVAKDKLTALNGDIKINTYDYRLDDTNAFELFSKYDVILDCTDNFETRYIIDDASIKAKKPFVYGSILEFKGQVAVFNYKGSASYRDLFPKINQNAKKASEYGILGSTAGIIGTLQASETIKILLNFGTILYDKLLEINLLTMEFNIFKINRD